MEENPNRSEGALPPSGVLAEQIERAFHYRGDVTLRLAGERSLSGYLFNRSGDGEDACVQVMLSDGQGSVSIPYREIQEITFSGADAADGKSFEAWKAKKNGEQKKEAEQIATDMRRQGFL
jgi:hypothetical protein